MSIEKCFDFRGKNALVTGASGGIGKAISKGLARQGANVAIVGRNTDILLELQRDIRAEIQHADMHVFTADLLDLGDIENLANQVEQVWSQVDVLVNAAGVWHDSDRAFHGIRLDQVSWKEINEVLDVNLRATMLLTCRCIPGMIAQKSGKIINISGTFSGGGAGWLHYYVSKQAIESFTIGLAQELRAFEIQVNCISPSDVATDSLIKFFPGEIETALQPDDVADLAYFLASSKADHLSGQIITIKSYADHT